LFCSRKFRLLINFINQMEKAGEQFHLRLLGLPFFLSFQEIKSVYFSKLSILDNYRISSIFSSPKFRIMMELCTN